MCSLSDLKIALKRLEQSGGKRIARRNARRAFVSALNTLRKEGLSAYPAIDKQGREVIITKPKGCVCPGCNGIMKSKAHFAAHWAAKHCNRKYSRDAIRCACGKMFNLKKFTRHVAHLKDVQVHFTLGMIGKVGELMQ